MEDVNSTYQRIDSIRSIAEMRKAMAGLDFEFRKKVILIGLACSKFQFTWSFFAKSFRVPENEWPAQPEWTKHL